MKIQFVSDLHLECYADLAYLGVTPASEADVLVIAGDICQGTGAIERFLKWPVPVIYVHGNHEMYKQEDLDGTITALREACAGTQIRFLENESLVLDAFPDIRFLGSCLWTDYLLFGTTNKVFCMYDCQRYLRDHSMIRARGLKFRPEDALERHLESKQWLSQQLEKFFDGKTVVVSHHGPHWNSVAERWRNDYVSAGFASDLTPMLDHADVWIHGHTHDSFDYRVGRARVVVNPRGYPQWDGTMENADFHEQRFVDV